MSGDMLTHLFDREIRLESGYCSNWEKSYCHSYEPEKGELYIFEVGSRISFIFCVHTRLWGCLGISLSIIVTGWPCLVLLIEIILVPQWNTRPADSIR